MAQIFKRGNTWSYRVWIDHTHSKSKGGFKRKPDAIAAARELELKKDKKLLSEDEGISFAGYFQSWIEVYKLGRLDENTEIRYRSTAKMIKDTFDNTPIDEITSMQYQKMIDAYAKKHAKASTSRINGYIRKAIKYAMNDGLLNRDFTFGVIISGSAPKDASLKFLEQNEAAGVKNFCLNNYSFKDIVYCQILFGLMTGCRYGEVCGLTWDCVDFKGKTITINKSYDYMRKTGFKKTKTASSVRTILIDHDLITMLKKLKMEQKEYYFEHRFTNPNKLVFLDKKKEIISNNGANYALKRILEEVGAKNIITFHGLRHTHASMLIGNNVSLDYIAERLGHSDTTITVKTYSHLLQESREREAAKSLKFLEGL